MLDEKDKDLIIVGIYNGTFGPRKLPKSVYLDNADKLKAGVYEGYGEAYTNPNTLVGELRTNIYMFSAAKTFQQTLEMTEALVKENKVVELKEFKEIAGEIFDKYNDTWLETEYQTAIGQARAATKWNEVQKHKKAFPVMQYKAVMDSHTCEICAPLDGVTLPVDDEFWDENMPLNHFGCKCVVIQMGIEEAEEDGGLSDEEEANDAAKASQATKNPLFNMNPGKDKAIFKDTGRSKHPYFEIPKAYKKLAGDNFGFDIPDKD